MSIAKIAVIVGASIITAGSTAAVATRDKWLPKDETTKVVDNRDSTSTSVPGSTGSTGSRGEASDQLSPGVGVGVGVPGG